MTKNLIFVFGALVVLILSSGGAHAQVKKVSAPGELDAYDQEALQKTQDLLRSKADRDAYINTDKKAQGADAHLNDVVGGDPALANDAYGIAADVMAILTKEHGGDSKKMAEALELKEEQHPGSQGFFKLD